MSSCVGEECGMLQHSAVAMRTFPCTSPYLMLQIFLVRNSSSRSADGILSSKTMALVTLPNRKEDYRPADQGVDMQ